MEERYVAVGSIQCDSASTNKVEVEFWKNRFLEKKGIPSPWLNKDSVVVAFHSCFLALKELGLKRTWVVLHGETYTDS
jgi:hypothetical protein